MMTDKQMEEYKRDYFMRFDHEPVNIEYIWDWIEDLVEEVERETKEIDRKLMEKVADSDYQFGFIRGTQTSESLTPLRISEHEEERKKIRKEMMERFYN